MTTRRPHAADIRAASSRTFGIGTLLAGVLLASALSTTQAVSAQDEWEVNPGSEGTEVIFESKAPMESFEGRTDQVEGRIELDPLALGDSIHVVVAVDLASLDTGISLRNQHMRENHLETEIYPKATFRGARLSEFPAALVVGETAHGRVRGSFELHGVVRPIEAEADLTLRPDGSLAVQAKFDVVLADFEIDRPKFLMLKLDERQRITVDLLALPADNGDLKE